MTNGHLLSAPWKDFMVSLSYNDEGAQTPLGFRPHKEIAATHKEKLWPYSTRKVSETGKVTYELWPFLEIMHRIFRNTLFPRIGNLDQVHSYLVDLLLFCQEEQGSQQVLDVSHVMWSELHSAVMERKCIIYGPYLMQLIEDTWAAKFPDEELVTDNMVSHDTIELRQKEKWSSSTPAPPVQETVLSDDEEEDDDGPEYVPPSEEPSWAKKLKEKMKRLFCLQAKGQYKAHKEAKMARRRDKAIMRQVGLEVADGSEEQITDEESWIRVHCPWSDTEEDTGVHTSPHAAEVSEDEEEEEHDW